MHMSVALSFSFPTLSSSPIHLRSHAPLSPLPMAILRRLHQNLNLNLNLHHLHHSRVATAAAALREDTTGWTQAPLSAVYPAAESLFHVAVDVSDSPDLATSHNRPGQYLQIRLSEVSKPSFLAIASPPSLAASRGVFEFLVKSVAGSTAELLCGLRKGNLVQVSPVMGGGFDVDRISPPEDYQTVLVFATGSGIR